MRITSYKTIFDEDRKPILVKEDAQNYHGTDTLSSPDAIAAMLNMVFDASSLTEEHVWLIAMNLKKRPVGVIEASHGTVNIAYVTPREVFTKLLLLGAVSFVVVHNHPSGDTEPSNEDIKLTELLKKCGELINIQLLDHIIIGEGYFSFKEYNMV